ncbi:hypothetical protein [Methylophaga thiooxydans]|nr:hypothetical protein [Methylophaga thiooxydans]
MRRQLAENIYQQCPIIYRGRHQGPDKNLMCFGFDCGSGWYDQILTLSIQIEKLTEKLRDRGVELGYLPMVTQVKEKYAGPRFYLTVSTEEMGELISKAEEDSLCICEECGAEEKLMTAYGRFLKTCCETHRIPGVPYSEVDDEDE